MNPYTKSEKQDVLKMAHRELAINLYCYRADKALLRAKSGSVGELLNRCKQSKRALISAMKRITDLGITRVTKVYYL